MKKLFRSIGFFFLRRGGIELDSEVIAMLSTMPSVEAELLKYTKVLVKVVDSQTNHGTSGEWKRHVAFAALQKKFPHMSKRQLAIAIEMALE